MHSGLRSEGVTAGLGPSRRTGRGRVGFRWRGGLSWTSRMPIDRKTYGKWIGPEAQRSAKKGLIAVPATSPAGGSSTMTRLVPAPQCRPVRPVGSRSAPISARLWRLGRLPRTIARATSMVSASSIPSPLRLVKEDRVFLRYRVPRRGGGISRLGVSG